MGVGVHRERHRRENLPAFVDPSAPFNRPDAISSVNDAWLQAVLTQRVVVGGSHPFLDPKGYRSHLMFQLTQMHYDMPDLYNTLLEHYVAVRATAPASAFAIGKQYDFQLIYEHSAMGIARTNPDYRYAYLPEDIEVQGSRVAWSLTILNSAPNREHAVRFLQLLFKPGDIGQTTLQQVGPSPISPPVVSGDDYAQLPAELKTLTTSGDPLAI